MGGHIKNIAVFCGSSMGTNPNFAKEAGRLGRLLGRRGYDLIYGGGFDGLMGVVSSEAIANGSKVTGVMIEAFKKAAEPYDIPPGMQELLVEGLMHRKLDMIFRADAAIILPGGIGTLDELGDIWATQDVRFHDAPSELEQPIIFLNTDGSHDGLKMWIERQIQDGFIKPGREKLIHFVVDPVQAIKVMDSYNRTGRSPVSELRKQSELPVAPKNLAKLNR